MQAKKDRPALGERRDLNPRVAESQSAALPLGYARQFFLQVYSPFLTVVNSFHRTRNQVFALREDPSLESVHWSATGLYQIFDPSTQGVDGSKPPSMGVGLLKRVRCTRRRQAFY